MYRTIPRPPPLLLLLVAYDKRRKGLAKRTTIYVNLESARLGLPFGTVHVSTRSCVLRMHAAARRRCRKKATT